MRKLRLVPFVSLFLIFSLHTFNANANKVISNENPENVEELAGTKKEIRQLRKELKKIEKDLSDLISDKKTLDEEEDVLKKKAWAEARKRKSRRNTTTVRRKEQKVLDRLTAKRNEISEVTAEINKNQSRVSYINSRIAHLSGYNLVKNTPEHHSLPKQELSKPEYSLKKEARIWIGTPYCYGGNSKSGIDCSGLTSQLYQSVYQISIPRTSADQYKQSNKVSKSRLEPGDLVFFKIKKSHVDHVGVYIGNNEFIHASSSRGVVISNLDQSYYSKHFVGGGRYKIN